jgi:colicin import membrane protein
MKETHMIQKSNTSGRTGVTYDAVASAAEAMLASGTRVTLRAVRENIGTGSLGTIQRHLSRWQDGQQLLKKPDVVLSPELSRSIQNEIQKSIAEVRSEMSQEIDETKSARNELAIESESRLAELDEATIRIAELENTLATKTGTIEQINLAIVSTEEKNTALTERVEQLSRDLARSELRMEQLPNLIRAAEAMREELQEEQAQRNHAEKNVARLESVDNQLAKLMTQYDAANVHIKELQSSLTEAESARREALVTVKNSESNISSIEIRLARAEKRSDEAELNSARIVENFLQLDVRSPLVKKAMPIKK